MKNKIYFLISILLNIFLCGYIILTKFSTNTDASILASRNTNDKILFIGNSIIAKCNWNELLENPDIINDGIGGITSSEILIRLNEFLNTNPKKIFFEMGSNDVQKNAHLQDIINNFYNILYAVRIKSPYTKVYFISVLPNEKLYSENRIELNERIDQLNSNIELFCKRYNAVYVEVNSLLKNKTGQLSHEYSLDGTHLTPLGYEKIKNKINFYIKN